MLGDVSRQQDGEGVMFFRLVFRTNDDGTKRMPESGWHPIEACNEKEARAYARQYTPMISTIVGWQIGAIGPGETAPKLVCEGDFKVNRRQT